MSKFPPPPPPMEPSPRSLYWQSDLPDLDLLHEAVGLGPDWMESERRAELADRELPVSTAEEIAADIAAVTGCDLDQCMLLGGSHICALCRHCTQVSTLGAAIAERHDTPADEEVQE